MSSFGPYSSTVFNVAGPPLLGMSSALVFSVFLHSPFFLCILVSLKLHQWTSASEWPSCKTFLQILASWLLKPTPADGHVILSKLQLTNGGVEHVVLAPTLSKFALLKFTGAWNYSRQSSTEREKENISFSTPYPHFPFQVEHGKADEGQRGMCLSSKPLCLIYHSTSFPITTK